MCLQVFIVNYFNYMHKIRMIMKRKNQIEFLMHKRVDFAKNTFDS